MTRLGTAELAAECWCGLAFVWIPRLAVGVRTLSCGQRGCRGPDGDARVGRLVGGMCDRPIPRSRAVRHAPALPR